MTTKGNFCSDFLWCGTEGPVGTRSEFNGDLVISKTTSLWTPWLRLAKGMKLTSGSVH